MLEPATKNIYERILLQNFTNREVYVVTPNDTLAYARKIMFRNNISKLVVIEGEKIFGIISLRDIANILTKLGSEIERSLDEILVKNVATQNVITLDVNRNVREACKLMHDKKIGSILITKEEKLAGIFTPTDACKVYSENPIPELKVKDVMNKDFEKINKISSIKKIIEKFKGGIDVLIVEDNKKPIGVITLSSIAYLEEDEFLKGNLKYIRGTSEHTKVRVDKTAADIMYAIDIAINETDSASKAVNYLLTYGIPALPVINEFGEIVGLISKRDIVALIAK